MSQILLDSNILNYGVRNYSNSTAEVLAKLKAANSLILSAYTSFEVYRGLNHDRIPTMQKLVNSFGSVEVDLLTFRLSAILATCYKNHEATKPFVSSYADGDVVLAASAFRYNTQILTANLNHFPRPFFETVSSYSIADDKGQKSIKIGLLKTNRAELQAAINLNYPKAT